MLEEEYQNERARFQETEQRLRDEKRDLASEIAALRLRLDAQARVQEGGGSAEGRAGRRECRGGGAEGAGGALGAQGTGEAARGCDDDDGDLFNSALNLTTTSEDVLSF
jgi:hypothetical protein